MNVAKTIIEESRQQTSALFPDVPIFSAAWTEEYQKILIEKTVKVCCKMVNSHMQHNNPYDAPLVLQIKDNFDIEFDQLPKR